MGAGVLQWLLSGHGLRAMRATMSILVLCSVFFAMVRAKYHLYLS